MNDETVGVGRGDGRWRRWVGTPPRKIRETGIADRTSRRDAYFRKCQLANGDIEENGRAL